MGIIRFVNELDSDSSGVVLGWLFQAVNELNQTHCSIRVEKLHL